ncbi:YsnF/AvaK domain-containing protein [Microbacterium oxydans]|jgi:uncharacterized protein (TIGR02271 family)|uniref:YsnF/AvaK domain-containing protein n=1 Tax=Microbacterium TaxID=33882 RepID=UPI002599B5D5|nr:YsnF/AvaK domain-containing protein [uncultured Microbacterium sp.]
MIPSDDGTAAVVVRREEILHVATETIALETVRIEKYIVTERRTFTADVRREELRVTRTPVTDPAELRPPVNTDPDRSITMVLHEEQLTITMKAIPVETVTVRVSTVNDEHRIEDILRREEIDIVEHNISDEHQPSSG